MTSSSSSTRHSLQLTKEVLSTILLFYDISGKRADVSLDGKAPEGNTRGVTSAWPAF